MSLKEYLSPEQIQKLYTDIQIQLASKKDIEQRLKLAKDKLDKLKSVVIADPSFTPAKNQAIEDGKFRAMFPDQYDGIESMEITIKAVQDNLTSLRETRDEYRLLVDYFAALHE